jgi:RpiR family carbohydrate utilization transcriptional regulator
MASDANAGSTDPNQSAAHQTAQSGGGALARLHALLPTLPPTDERVARSILEAPDATVHRSVSEAAEAAGASTATVVRFAQKAGFRGFHDLKLALARDLAAVAAVQADRADPATAGTTLGEVLDAGVQTLRDASALVDSASFVAAAERIAEADRVLFVAVGTSAALAQDAAYRFNTIGVRGEAPPDVHAQHVVARGLSPEDVCIAVSHTGSTRETLAAVAAANTAGATTIAVTSFMRSPLTELAAITLVAGARELTLRLEAVASRLAHMAVLDALLLDVVRRTEPRAHDALERYADVLSEHRM